MSETRELNSGEQFCRHARRMWRNICKKFRRFASFSFQEKGPQEISREKPSTNPYLIPQETKQMRDKSRKWFTFDYIWFTFDLHLI